MYLRGTHMKQATIFAAFAASALAMGLTACTQKQETPPPVAAPAEITVNPPAVNITAPPAATGATSTESTTTTSPDPATGDPGSTSTTTTTTEKK